MALKKKIQSINGVTSNYHRIISVNFDMLNNKAVVYIAHYINKDIRDKEKEIVKAEKEANDCYELLNNYSLTSNQREVYISKLDKLNKILANKINGEYYVDLSEVELENIKNLTNINYIYERLKDLEIYSGAQEV